MHFDKLPDSPQIAVVGLGYVGLPLAVELARHFSVIGYDISHDRINELKKGIDTTGEIEQDILLKAKVRFSYKVNDLKFCDIFIVTVPTPVNADNSPDLEPLKSASETIATVIKPGAIIVYESTVYPGVTEDICGPILEKISEMKSGVDFYLGYSPERIDVGNKKIKFQDITKIVSAQNDTIAKYLSLIYGSINGNNIYIAPGIKVAEAAKVIENMQRDVNIAFINEVTTVLLNAGISVFDVLDAASTKWNFVDYKPGLVGGHCIGVDPYYFIQFAKNLENVFMKKEK